MTAVTPAPIDVVALRASRTRGETVRGYVALTKPRIIELLLVTTVPAMVLADRGMPSLWLIVATLVGGSLAAGSANTINCYVDRDIDVKMHRTERRPLARDVVTPAEALRFGVVLGVLATLWLGAFVNWLSAGLGVAAILFYVFVYTIGMKRTTPQNIVIGGAAGCVPVLIGWASVTGRVSIDAWVLFAIIFFWTPPHFWALAMKFSDDYARAGVPMLPTVRGARVSAQQILLYTVLLAIASLVPVALGTLGWIYAIAATALGGRFIWLAVRLLRAPDDRATARRTFLYSLLYLALLFVAMGADSALL
jgi:protoheme IX farnesyltransferase